MLSSAAMILATDLDRTLFPNGKQIADASMPLLKKLIKENEIEVIYVTGRNAAQIEQGMKEYDPPLPTFAIAEVGTRIYQYKDGQFIEDTGYIERLNNLSPDWDAQLFKKKCETISALTLQPLENQNRFKISYNIHDLTRASEIVDQVQQLIKPCCDCFEITYSVDETVHRGLLDILPQRANKMEGIEYLREKEGIAMNDLLYAGDSGNDISALTHGYKAVLVANAIDDVKEQTKRIATEKKTLEQIHFASGHDELNLNGCYHSGIIEALYHFDDVLSE